MRLFIVLLIIELLGLQVDHLLLKSQVGVEDEGKVAGGFDSTLEGFFKDLAHFSVFLLDRGQVDPQVSHIVSVLLNGTSDDGLAVDFVRDRIVGNQLAKVRPPLMLRPFVSLAVR